MSGQYLQLLAILALDFESVAGLGHIKHVGHELDEVGLGGRREVLGVSVQVGLQDVVQVVGDVLEL